MLPKAPHQGPQPQDARPNFVVRAIAGLSISFRFKLLSAFLGVTFLMAGLAGVGLETLRQTNARTEQLLRDQERIAFFNELHVSLSELNTLATATGLDPTEVNAPKVPSIFFSTSYVLNGGTDNLMNFTGQGLRKFARPGMPDETILHQLREDAKLLQPIAHRIHEIRQTNDIKSAGGIARQEFFPIAARMQRLAYSRVQDIEADMSDAARSTALAYEASRGMVIASAYIAIGLAFFLGYSISSSLIWPVQRITSALDAVAKGDFTARVSVPNRDELGDLAQNVNVTSERLGELYAKVEDQRAQLAAEHVRSENLLRNLLPDQIATRLKATPDKTIADYLPLVAILFADIVGFTPRSAKMSPEEIVECLNGVFSAFDELTEQHELEKIKTIGDSYMVAAGVPTACENPVHKIAEMALDMLEATKSMPGDIQIRIGLHAGPAVAGVIGHQKLFYDVWGETVNVASRMESHGEPGRIQVTSPARERLGRDYQFAPRGRVDIDGVGPVETWWLTGKA